MDHNNEEFVPKDKTDIVMGQMSVKTWRQLVGDLLVVEQDRFSAENLENYRFSLTKLLKIGETLPIPINEMVMVNFCKTCVHTLIGDVNSFGDMSRMYHNQKKLLDCYREQLEALESGDYGAIVRSINTLNRRLEATLDENKRLKTEMAAILNNEPEAYDMMQEKTRRLATENQLDLEKAETARGRELAESLAAGVLFLFEKSDFSVAADADRRVCESQQVQSKLEAEKHDLESQLASLKRDLESQKQSLSEKSGQESRLEAQNCDLESRVKSLSQKHEEAARALANAQSELGEIQRSLPTGSGLSSGRQIAQFIAQSRERERENEARVRDLERSVEGLRKDASQAHAAESEMGRELERSKRSLEEMKSAIDSGATDKSNLESRLKKLSVDDQRHQSEAEQQRSRASEAEAERDSLTLAKRGLESDLSRLLETLLPDSGSRTLEGALAEWKRQKSELEKLKKDLSRHNKVSEESLQNRDVELKHLEASLSSAEKQRDDLRRELNDCQVSKSELLSKLKSKSDEFNDSKKKDQSLIEELQEANGELLKKNMEWNTNEVNLTKTIVELHRNLEEMRADLKDRQRQIESLTSQLQDEKRARQKAVSDLNTSLASLKEQIKQLELAKQTLEGRVESLQTRVAALTEERARLEQEKKELTQQLGEMTTRQQALEKRLAQYKEKYQNEAKYHADFEKQCQLLSKQLAATREDLKRLNSELLAEVNSRKATERDLSRRQAAEAELQGRVQEGEESATRLKRELRALGSEHRDAQCALLLLSRLGEGLKRALSSKECVAAQRAQENEALQGRLQSSQSELGALRQKQERTEKRAVKSEARVADLEAQSQALRQRLGDAEQLLQDAQSEAARLGRDLEQAKAQSARLDAEKQSSQEELRMVKDRLEPLLESTRKATEDAQSQVAALTDRVRVLGEKSAEEHAVNVKLARLLQRREEALDLAGRVLCERTAECSRLGQALSTAQTTLSEAQRDGESAKETMEQARAALGRAQGEQIQLEETLAEVHRALEEQQGENAALVQRQRFLEAQKTAQEARGVEIAEENERLKMERHALQEQLQDQQRTQRSLELSLAATREMLASEKESGVREAERMRASLEASDRELCEAREALEALRVAGEENRARLSQSERDLKKVNDMYSSLYEEFHRVDEESRQRAARLDSTTAELLDRQEALSRASEEREAMVSRLTVAERDLQSARACEASASERLRSIEAETAELRRAPQLDPAEKSELKTQIGALEKARARLQATCDYQEDTIRRLEATLRQRESQCLTVHSDNQQLVSRVEITTERCLESEAQLKENQQRNERLSSELERRRVLHQRDVSRATELASMIESSCREECELLSRTQERELRARDEVLLRLGAPPTALGKAEALPRAVEGPSPFRPLQ